MMLPASGVTGQGSNDGAAPPRCRDAAPVPALVALALVGGAVAAVVGVPGVGLPFLSGGAVAAVVPGIDLPAVSGPLISGPLIGSPLIGGPLVRGALVAVALIRRRLLHRVLRIPHDCPFLPRTGSRPVAIVDQLAA